MRRDRDPNFINEQKLQLLPKRTEFNPLRVDGLLQQPTQFRTNCYQIQLKEKSLFLYQYVVQTDPPIPLDSTKIWYKLVKNIQKKLQKQIGLISHRSNTLWGNKSLVGQSLDLIWTSKYKTQVNQNSNIQTSHNVSSISDPSTITDKSKMLRQYKNVQTQYRVSIKQTSKLDIRSLLTDQKQKGRIIQIINIKIKDKLQSLGYLQLGKGKFYERSKLQQNRVEEVGLQVLRGFKFSLLSLKQNRLCLQIDPCSRILQTPSLNDIIKKLGKQAQYRLKGAVVSTRYGNYKTYKVDGIEWRKFPTTYFLIHQTRKGKKPGDLAPKTQKTQKTYAQYFKQAYNITIKDMKQPLIRIYQKPAKIIKQGAIKQKPNFIYLIPELLSLTGITQQQRKDRSAMQAIAPYTKLTPKQRLKQTQRAINQLQNLDKKKEKESDKGDFSMIAIKQPTIIKGYQLNPVKVQRRGVQEIQNGQFDLRKPILNPAKFNDWIIFCSNATKKQKFEGFINVLKKCSKDLQIIVKDPFTHLVQYKQAEKDHHVFKSHWIDSINKQLSRQGKPPQIVVFYLQSFQQKFYPQIKKILINKFGVVSQVVKAQTIEKQSGSLSIATGILVQMNQKIGKTVWKILRNHPQFESQNYKIFIKNNLKKKEIQIKNSQQSSSNQDSSIIQSEKSMIKSQKSDKHKKEKKQKKQKKQKGEKKQKKQKKDKQKNENSQNINVSEHNNSSFSKSNKTSQFFQSSSYSSGALKSDESEINQSKSLSTNSLISQNSQSKLSANVTLNNESQQKTFELYPVNEQSQKRQQGLQNQDKQQKQKKEKKQKKQKKQKKEKQQKNQKKQKKHKKEKQSEQKTQQNLFNPLKTQIQIKSQIKKSQIKSTQIQQSQIKQSQKQLNSSTIKQQNSQEDKSKLNSQSNIENQNSDKESKSSKRRSDKKEKHQKKHKHDKMKKQKKQTKQKQETEKVYKSQQDILQDKKNKQLQKQMRKAKKQAQKSSIKIQNTNNLQIACAGFSSSTSPSTGKYTISFVGTTNKHQTQVYTHCRYGLKNKQSLSDIQYELIFNYWLKTYYEKTDKSAMPQVLIVYRQGISQGQLKKQIYRQVRALKRIIKQKVPKQLNYDPQIIYLTVNKRTSARFFDNTSKQPKNAKQGSVVFDQMVRNNSMDFFLISQHVESQDGTASPTQYRIVYRNRYGLSEGALAQFTFQQCFNYYNWAGSVKIPAPLQCAGEKVRQNIFKIDPKKKNMEEKTKQLSQNNQNDTLKQSSVIDKLSVSSISSIGTSTVKNMFNNFNIEGSFSNPFNLFQKNNQSLSQDKTNSLQQSSLSKLDETSKDMTKNPKAKKPFSKDNRTRGPIDKRRDQVALIQPKFQRMRQIVDTYFFL